jgi:hypothetical protein
MGIVLFSQIFLIFNFFDEIKVIIEQFKQHF